MDFEKKLIKVEDLRSADQVRTRARRDRRAPPPRPADPDRWCCAVAATPSTPSSTPDRRSRSATRRCARSCCARATNNFYNCRSDRRHGRHHQAADGDHPGTSARAVLLPMSRLPSPTCRRSSCSALSKSPRCCWEPTCWRRSGGSRSIYGARKVPLSTPALRPEGTSSTPRHGGGQRGCLTAPRKCARVREVRRCFHGSL